MRGIPCATPLFGTFYAYEQSRGPGSDTHNGDKEDNFTFANIPLLLQIFVNIPLFAIIFQQHFNNNMNNNLTEFG